MNAGFDYRVQVDSTADGMAVLDFLARRYRHSSAEDWIDRIQARRILLDDRPVEPNARLRPGQWLLWRRPPWEEPEAPLDFAVLHRNEHFLAVAKPGGLPTLPGGGFLAHTLMWQVRLRFPDARPLHRLGRATSGLVLFGRTRAARATMSAAWREGRILKVYRALASGIPSRNRFSIEIPIGPVPHPLLGTVHGASSEGKHARTDVRVLETAGENSLVEVVIATGRPHQIRIHLAAAGHPLVGDSLYASGGMLSERAALPGDSGYLLHAARLGFAHPCTGLPVEIECQPPPLLRDRNTRRRVEAWGIKAGGDHDELRPRL